ncbi:hypothetical protein BGI42_13000 [Clostridium taeniosporum]|uniref:Uncharacterized protein n=1 Tax=Clostridium taeniosporum TaxID=394958 RepID=A0A1D7XN36_9CLOT|nr:hypothetical protein BGI42_13000 [Clostridium taeniosporum]
MIRQCALIKIKQNINKKDKNKKINKKNTIKWDKNKIRKINKKLIRDDKKIYIRRINKKSKLKCKSYKFNI